MQRATSQCSKASAGRVPRRAKPTPRSESRQGKALYASRRFAAPTCEPDSEAARLPAAWSRVELKRSDGQGWARRLRGLGLLAYCISIDKPRVRPHRDRESIDSIYSSWLTCLYLIWIAFDNWKLVETLPNQKSVNSKFNQSDTQFLDPRRDKFEISVGLFPSTCQEIYAPRSDVCQ